MDDILKIKVKSVIEEANIYFRNIIETSQAHGICEHSLNIRNGKKRMATGTASGTKNNHMRKFENKKVTCVHLFFFFLFK